LGVIGEVNREEKRGALPRCEWEREKIVDKEFKYFEPLMSDLSALFRRRNLPIDMWPGYSGSMCFSLRLYKRRPGFIPDSEGGTIGVRGLPDGRTRIRFVLGGFPDLDLFQQMADEIEAEMVRLGFIAPQPPLAGGEAGKKPGPMDSKLDALLTGQKAIREDLSGLRQAVLARFDASEQTIIETVTERLDQGQLATVQAVLDAIEAELVPMGELEETLVAVQHTLSEIQQQGVALPDSALTNEEVEHLSEVVYASKLDAKHKLKVTVPIIPYFLSYEGEVELKSGLNLEAAWKRLVAKIRDTRNGRHRQNSLDR
jgi:hypothetical protein